MLASNPASTSPLQFQQANSLTNTTLDTSASGPNSPADPSGAVGPNSLVLMDSNTYQVLDKSDGVVSQTSTLNQFWADALGPEISIENTTAYEPSASSSGDALVTVRLSSTPLTNVTVSYTTTAGSATPGTDYTTRTNTLTFTPTGSLVQTISIPLIPGDTAFSGVRTFSVNLSSPIGGNLENSSATVSLLAAQPTTSAGSPSVSLSLSSNPFLNSTGTATVTATLSATNPTAPTVINLIFGGTASLGLDYTTSSESIVIPAGSTTGTITLTRNEIQQSNDPALVIVGVGSAFGANVTTPQEVVATLTAGVFQPHVVYDPVSGRWYASALDDAIPPGSVGPADLSNNILLAVSLTSDPTQGWVGFSIPVDRSTTATSWPISIRSASTPIRSSSRPTSTTS